MVAFIGIPAVAFADIPALAHPFSGWPLSGPFDRLFTPLVRWDALYYLSIAADGYAPGDSSLINPDLRPAFFPSYPLTVRWLSGFGIDLGLVVIVGQIVALVSFLVALVLLARLTEIELGRRFVRPTLLLLAFSPMAFFFSAPFSESMFLALSVGAFLAARTGHWALAGGVLAVASATRVPGVLLVVPVLLIYLYGPRADRSQGPPRHGWQVVLPVHRPRPDLLWLGLAPVGLLAFMAFLSERFGAATAFLDLQGNPAFQRVSAPPWEGLWQAATIAAQEAADVLAGRPLDPPGPPHPENLIAFLFLLLTVVGGVGALRRLPAAYGAWVILGIFPALMSVRPGYPLFAFPRYALVLFPVFMWAALVLEPRGLTRRVVGGSAVVMSLFTVAFVSWVFVA
jgi:hypothetical protein